MKQLETQIKETSVKFGDQVKCLETKLNVDNGILANIQDLYKRRAAIEHEYSENLFRLSYTFSQRTKIEDQRRPKWKNYSASTILTRLVASTQHTGRLHHNLSDIYGKQMTQRLVDMQEDNTRLTKKSIEILQHQHAIVTESLQYLSGTQKQYIKLFTESFDARKKACKAIEQLDKEVIKCQEKKKEFEKNPKIKRLKEDYLERSKFYKDKHEESTIARNKYLMSLEAVKATIARYYEYDLKKVVECSEYGFHNNLTRLCMNHASCEEAQFTVHESINKLFINTSEAVDAHGDTEIFITANQSLMRMYDKITNILAKEDNITMVVHSCDKVKMDLDKHLNNLQENQQIIEKTMTDEKEKLDSLSNTLNDLINQSDYDVTDYICGFSNTESNSLNNNNVHSNVKEKGMSLSRPKDDSLYHSMQKRVRDNRIQTEATYMQLMDSFLQNNLRSVDISMKLDCIQSVTSGSVPASPAFTAAGSDTASSPTGMLTNHHRDCCGVKIKPMTALLIGIRSKLFGGDLKKYCEEQKELVPTVVRSCIRLIRQYGIKNVGVFRVPGSQTDVMTYKSQFEYGIDPLRNLTGSVNDVNLAASLLKLYFRELVPPILDKSMFTKIVDNYESIKQDDEKTNQFLHKLLLSSHEAVYATTKYLLAFLNHLVEYSSFNCMDVMNLAIIFGPCLMPVPSDQNNQLFQYQGIVNHVTQCLITYHTTVFSRSLSESEQQVTSMCTNFEYSKTGENDEQLDSILKKKKNSSLSSGDELASLDNQSASELDKISLNDSLTGSVEDDLSPKSSVKKFKSFRSFRYKKPELKKLRRNDSSRVENKTPPMANRQQRSTSESDKLLEIIAIATGDYVAKSPEELSFSRDDKLILTTKISQTWWQGYLKSNPNKDLGNVPNSLITFSILPSNNSSPNNRMKELLFKEERKKSIGSIDSLSVDNLNDEAVEGSEAEIVQMRRGSCTNQSHSDNVSTELQDEEFQMALGCLNQIEQSSIRKNRNTVHIDKSSLTKSKFISPFELEGLSATKKWSNRTSPVNDERDRRSNVSSGSSSHGNNVSIGGSLTKASLASSNSIEFKLKKPSSQLISTIANVFEMNSSPHNNGSSMGPPPPQRQPFSGKLKHSALHQSDSNISSLVAASSQNPSSIPPPIQPKPKIIKNK